VVATLYERLADFRRADDPEAMAPADFDDFPPTRRTLRQWLAANSELEAVVRDVVVPTRTDLPDQSALATPSSQGLEYNGGKDVS
jgi:hypothetical protein